MENISEKIKRINIEKKRKIEIVKLLSKVATTCKIWSVKSPLISGHEDIYIYIYFQNTYKKKQRFVTTSFVFLLFKSHQIL